MTQSVGNPAAPICCGCQKPRVSVAPPPGPKGARNVRVLLCVKCDMGNGPLSGPPSLIEHVRKGFS